MLAKGLYKGIVVEVGRDAAELTTGPQEIV